MIADALKARAWMCLAILLGAAAGVQTWRLHLEQLENAGLVATAATGRADRAEAYAKDSDKTAGKEQVHAATTQEASDAFTQSQPARDDSLRADLARAERLRVDADKRAAGYRAQAEAGATACRSLADRSESLDRQLTEGLHVVGELRGVIKKRDAEVVLLRRIVDADRELLQE